MVWKDRTIYEYKKNMIKYGIIASFIVFVIMLIIWILILKSNFKILEILIPLFVGLLMFTQIYFNIIRTIKIMEKKPSITINNNKIILSDGRQYQIKNIKHIFLPGNHLGFIATNEQDYENISKCINKINQLFKNYSNSLACGLTRSLIYWNAINQLRKKIKPIRILNHKDMLKNLKVPYNKSKYGLIIINQR